MYAEKGMTWGEWCDSSYNVSFVDDTYGELKCDNSYDDHVRPRSNLPGLADESNVLVRNDDEIVGGTNYALFVYID